MTSKELRKKKNPKFQRKGKYSVEFAKSKQFLPHYIIFYNSVTLKRLCRHHQQGGHKVWKQLTLHYKWFMDVTLICSMRHCVKLQQMWCINTFPKTQISVCIASDHLRFWLLINLHRQHTPEIIKVVYIWQECSPFHMALSTNLFLEMII